MSASSVDGATLGSRIRGKRKAHKLTLVEVATACGLSPSFLSQIERDQASPSVATLYALARILQTPIATFFAEPESTAGGQTAPTNGINAQVVRADRRKQLIYPGSGIRSEMLSPDLQRAIQLLWVVMPPGTDSGDEPFVHDGEECGVILQGQVETWIGDERYLLGPGDAIYHSSTIPHRSRNVGDTEVIIVVAKTPPSF
jgi:transcriptional regulator with XRE-family HTH domain